MSQWIQVEATLEGVVADLSKEATPQGSEGGAPLWRCESAWLWHASLRDRDEDDAAEIRDWFADLCRRTNPTVAELRIDTGGSRYHFQWHAAAQNLCLDIPRLYQEGMQ